MTTEHTLANACFLWARFSVRWHKLAYTNVHHMHIHIIRECCMHSTVSLPTINTSISTCYVQLLWIWFNMLTTMCDNRVYIFYTIFFCCINMKSSMMFHVYIYTTRIYPSASLRHTAGEWEASPRAPSPATTLSQPKHDDDDNQKRTSNMNQPKWLTSHHSEPREIDLHCIVEHQEYV